LAPKFFLAALALKGSGLETVAATPTISDKTPTIIIINSIITAIGKGTNCTCVCETDETLTAIKKVMIAIIILLFKLTKISTSIYKITDGNIIDKCCVIGPAGFPRKFLSVTIQEISL
jgi:hypothetical protein